jgi:hypothetical protein
MIRRSRTLVESQLCRRERLVEYDAAGRHRRAQRRKQIALQISAHHDYIEALERQRMRRQIGAPCADAHALRRGAFRRARDNVRRDVDAERAKAGARQRNRMASAPHRHVERAAAHTALSRDPIDPFDDERRR